MLCLRKVIRKSISEQTAYEIDEEVRSLLNEARTKLKLSNQIVKPIKLIAEALLKYETLDSTKLNLFTNR